LLLCNPEHHGGKASIPARRGLFQPGIFKDRGKRRASAVRERIRPGLAIVRDNPRTAIDCIAFATMPTAAWSMPVAAQNKITRSCALSFVVAFAMVCSRPQLLANAAIAASRDGS
jgi:hypothetical protein